MDGFTNPEYEDLLFTKAPVAMAYVGRNGKFTAINEAFCELVGYSAYELAARHFASITHPDDVEADRAEADRLASDPEGGNYQMLKRYITKTGQVVWVRLCVAALRKEGQFAHYVVHALDLPPASGYKVEPTATGVSVRPSVRWLDLLRDHPRESIVVLALTGTVFKLFDTSVLTWLMEFLKLSGSK